jgi:hypothetical protein
MSAAAVDDDDTDAAMPALTKRVAKSRRVMSPGYALFVGWVFSSSVMASSCKEFSASRWQTAPFTMAMAHPILGGAAVHRCDNRLVKRRSQKFF